MRTSEEDYNHALMTEDTLALDLRDARATIAEQKERITHLEKENFALAAGQCCVKGGLRGDDYGNPYCSLEARLALADELAKHVRRFLTCPVTTLGSNRRACEASLAAYRAEKKEGEG